MRRHLAARSCRGLSAGPRRLAVAEGPRTPAAARARGRAHRWRQGC
uniref:Uncharacterized protein n=1 Tax=Arundo donax TaxID=35708 RepID=A0A0A9A833_ARUDO